MSTILIISISILLINTIIVYSLKFLIPNRKPVWVNGVNTVKAKYRSWYFALFYVTEHFMITISPLPFYLMLFDFSLEYSTGSISLTILNITFYYDNVKFKYWLDDNYNRGKNSNIFEK